MSGQTIPMTGKAAAHMEAAALRAFEGLDAVARWRHGLGWHVYVRGQA